MSDDSDTIYPSRVDVMIICGCPWHSVAHYSYFVIRQCIRAMRLNSTGYSSLFWWETIDVKFHGWATQSLSFFVVRSAHPAADPSGTPDYSAIGTSTETERNRPRFSSAFLCFPPLRVLALSLQWSTVSSTWIMLCWPHKAQVLRWPIIHGSWGPKIECLQKFDCSKQ